MSEKIVSPGVFTRENDLSYLPQGIGEIGAAIIGPTVKGPAGVPTYVSSYSDFQTYFGDTFKSGSQYYQFLTSHAAQQYFKYGNVLLVTRILAGDYAPAQSYVPSSGSWDDESAVDAAFTLTTLGDGAIMNSSGSEGTNNVLANGTKDNIRWEISNVNTTKGTFSLLIRRGNDSIKRPVILESWNDLTLDPNSSNYIAKRIGDQTMTLVDEAGMPFLQASGEYPNKSKYVRVTVNKFTVDYLDENGAVRVPAASASLPHLGASGSFYSGSDGTVANPRLMYGDIEQNNSQGYDLGASTDATNMYTKMISLLSNQDDYDFNLLLLPGVISSVHGTIATAAVEMCENRGDAMTIIDPVVKGSTITDATTVSSGYDSSYATMYWSWLQIPDLSLGKNVWVPASVVVPAAYAFNDKVAAEWFAPAGLNRGGLESVIQCERKLTRLNRDDMYDASLNPIATFPREGIAIWGQKTLQKKASALDRVNVRRLLITTKKYLASMSRYLVFEQNTAATRLRFLNIANPYFESIQQRQGLYAFKVVMDETNNTPDVIDRNQLRGQIYLQPARTAEFIILDFNVMPTGAVFPGDEK